jgi:hypothetical protein
MYEHSRGNLLPAWLPYYAVSAEQDSADFHPVERTAAPDSWCA